MGLTSSVSFIRLLVNKTHCARLGHLVGKAQRVWQLIYKLPLFFLAVPFVLIIRLMKPWILIRIGGLISVRIGHFGANTELYLCERDAGINVPKKRYIDLFFLINPICNLQLASMWRRVLHVWPAWMLNPIARINRMIPGGTRHEIGHNTQQDRDVNNLLDRFPPHLHFNAEELARGEAGLRAMGIPHDASFVCLIVRDSAYLDTYLTRNWNYHNYRDSDVQNYILAAEALASRGYFVIRMGAKVHAPMNTQNPKIINYATNGMRDDFLDIYLGAMCTFCVTTGTGWDAIPGLVFRRPVCYVNHVPVGDLCTYISKAVLLSKHHFSLQMNRDLSLSEIFASGVGYSIHTSDYDSKRIRLIENTPEEIRDVVIEMAERQNGIWQANAGDNALQLKFWEIFLLNAAHGQHGRPMHGRIHAFFGATFLRDNQRWLDTPPQVDGRQQATSNPELN